MECPTEYNTADGFSDRPLALTVSKAAKRLGVDRRTLRKHAAVIGIRLHEVGNSLAMSPEDFGRLRQHFARRGDRETIAAG